MNKLYYGDNLEVMRKYIEKETVDLCYIESPFNSKRTYNQIYNNIGKEDKAQAQAFIDTWTWDDDATQEFNEIRENYKGAYTSQTIELINGFERVLSKSPLLSYLVHMAQRITEIHRILKPTGSFYLHCDPTASHYLKLILDSIFCSGTTGEFLNEIIWQRTNAHNFKAKYFGRTHDVIFFYSKTSNYTWNQLYSTYSAEQLSRFQEDKDGRLFTGRDLTMTTATKGSDRNFEWRGSRPPSNRVWGYSLEKLETLYAEGKILLKANGSPRLDGLKVYLDELPGKMLIDIWTDIERIGNTSNERLGYPTQKPEALLEKIINSSSNKGDVIFDAYCGCGTSIAVAERLGREWIGIDITYQSISLILYRMEKTFGKKILPNIQLTGVPQDFESAVALANKPDDKTRKEFEKWFILSYSDNRAIINEKKGGDGGIDGTVFMLDRSEKNDHDLNRVLFSVKSNKTLDPKFVRDLFGTMEREKAVMGYFLTLYPMKNLVAESKKYGSYHNKLLDRDFPKIEVVSVQELLDGKRMPIPATHEIAVIKSAEAKGKNDSQHKIDLQ